MSKQKVGDAVRFWLSGRHPEATAALATVVLQFARKRLLHLVAIDQISQADARALFAAAFPTASGLPDAPEGPRPTGSGRATAATMPAIYSPASSALPISRKIVLTSPNEFLAWCSALRHERVAVDDFRLAQPWGLVAIAALARVPNTSGIHIDITGMEPAGRFAYALGLRDVIDGRASSGSLETDRTVKLRRIDHFPDIERVASQVSTLITREPSTEELYIDRDEVRLTIKYVLVELMRNVLQHSHDPLGGVLVAQSMRHGQEYHDTPAVQVAVADAGIGIPDALRRMHGDITTPEMALERSIWPYFSGAFDSTQRGTSQNAGLGLFFISEMAKITGGRLLIASRGASMFIQGDEAGEHNDVRLLTTGYPGTLVVFEVPKRGLADHGSLIKVITERAEQRASRKSRRPWLRFDLPTGAPFECFVAVASEDTTRAQSVAREDLIPRLARTEPIVMNFANIDICTQSFLHALLFDAIRVSWATRTPIFIAKASDAVRDGLKLLQSYALDDSEDSVG